MNIQSNIPQALWESIRANYNQANYTGAILDATYFLTDLLRKRSGADGDGAALVGQALGGLNPKIKISKDQTETELSIQKGIEQIIRGWYLGVRNPRVHGKFNDSELDAFSLIVFIGFIINQIEQAKVQFSTEDFIKRVLEEGFVPSVKYAELLCLEIPAGQRLEVFHNLYQRKTQWKLHNIKIFFTALMKNMVGADLDQIYSVISEEMKSIDNDNMIENIMNSFDPSFWPNVQEVSRLRIEYRILSSLRVGECKSYTLVKGRLGQLAATYLPYLSLKAQFIQQITWDLTYGTSGKEDYIKYHIIPAFSKSLPLIPDEISEAYKKGLLDDKKEIYSGLVHNSSWKEKVWSPSLLQEVENYRARHPDCDEDEIPF